MFKKCTQKSASSGKNTERKLGADRKKFDPPLCVDYEVEKGGCANTVELKKINFFFISLRENLYVFVIRSPG